jgi:hypothetical protein
VRGRIHLDKLLFTRTQPTSEFRNLQTSIICLIRGPRRFSTVGCVGVLKTGFLGAVGYTTPPLTVASVLARDSEYHSLSNVFVSICVVGYESVLRLSQDTRVICISSPTIESSRSTHLSKTLVGKKQERHSPSGSRPGIGCTPPILITSDGS